MAGNSIRCYLLTYHSSCAVVSVFWLRQEIVIGCTVYKKDSYLLSLIDRESASKCVYFVRSNTLLLCNSLLCIYLLGSVFFMLSYFVIVFWLTFFNAGQMISAVVAACCCYHHGEKRLVNSITFFLYFVGSGSVALAALQQRWRRQKHGGGGQLGGGGGSLVEAKF